MNPAPLILDTNLLLLFVVGAASQKYIAKHKRLTQFIEADYQTLLTAISPAPAVFVTPHTLAETSNLAAYIADPARSKIFGVLREVIERSEELYLSSAAAARRPEFIRLGLTDATLLDAGAKHMALLTTDLNLYLAALANGSRAYNFNHLRDSYMN